MSRRRGADKSGLDLQISARTGRSFVAHLRRNLPVAHQLAGSNLRELSLALVGDASMARLHAQFLKIDGPTDVLTFELEHDQDGKVIAGEVVICVPEARRQCRKWGTKPQNELLLYAIHGLLHLSGYDDLTEKGYRAMHREEDRILKALKIGPVFQPQGMMKDVRDPHTVRARDKDGRSR